MHHTARLNAELFFSTYATGREGLTIAEIGSLDVNGSIRDAAPRGARYLGLDFMPGKGVDIVLDDPYALPLADASQDIVVSSSCFEHSEMFWLVFGEILRVLKPNGLFYLNAPSNGPIHRYPSDCWRFYPDAGRALVAWGRRCGYPVALLESFVAAQAQGPFNDFVAVFIRDEMQAPNYPRRMIERAERFTNGSVLGRDEILNKQTLPEDQRKLATVSAALAGRVLLVDR